MSASKHIVAIVAFLAVLSVIPAGAQWDPGSSASNLGSIVNTRHNLSLPFVVTTDMDKARNNYGEVCIYCHTPHGASGDVSAPLWNRTNGGNTYTMYSIPLTSGNTPTQPGVNSLTCLSCHDGTVAIDSIINMPGSGNYLASQATSQSNSFLDTWTNTSGVAVQAHGAISDCMTACHNAGNIFGVPDFAVFVIGTDLNDDHPVGVPLPNTTTYDFNAPSGTSSGMKFYDTNTDGRANSDEVRFYDTGEGFEVECASCHDPHGVPSGGQGSLLVPAFLRVSNTGSALCLTCHAK